MSSQEHRNAKYEAHIQAVEEHKALLEKLQQPETSVELEEVKYSLQNMALTLEEYLKLLGLP